MRTPLTACGRAALLVVGSVFCVQVARADDPFQPGMRWRAVPSILQPSIPKAVTFAKNGNFLWAASSGAFTKLQLFAVHQNGRVPTPLATLTPPNTLGSLAVDAADRGDSLFALVQVQAPDSTHRATLVSRYAATPSAWSGALNATWTFDSGLRANGPARLGSSADGARVFVVNWNGPTPEVRLDVLDGQTGASVANVMLAANALNEMCVAADGTRAAITAGQSLWIVDQNANAVHHAALPLATAGLAVSGDGALVAVGGSTVRVLADNGSAYTTDFEVQGLAGELATRLAVSRDGRTLAIGWWNATNGVDARFEVVDVQTHARLFERVLIGVAGGLQNSPEVVRVSPDGERAAFGAWGDGTNAPEVILYDRTQNTVVLTADVPGSVFALDLDVSGRRVALGIKLAHANQFALIGEFRMYDTGESDTAVMSAPQLGSAMQITAQKPGASVVAFLSGPRAPTPVRLGGVGGSLALDRTQMTVMRRAADASGRADIAMPIANDPLLVGTYRHLQSGFLVNGTWVLGASVLDVLVY